MVYVSWSAVWFTLISCLVHSDQLFSCLIHCGLQFGSLCLVVWFTVFSCLVHWV